MPIFVYAAPVTGTAAIALTLVAAATETAAAVAAGVRGGVVGWALSGRYAALVVYLALVPGIIGHTGFNTLLRCVWGGLLNSCVSQSRGHCCPLSAVR